MNSSLATGGTRPPNPVRPGHGNCRNPRRKEMVVGWGYRIILVNIIISQLWTRPTVLVCFCANFRGALHPKPTTLDPAGDPQCPLPPDPGYSTVNESSWFFGMEALQSAIAELLVFHPIMYSVLSHKGKRVIKVKGSILWNKLPADTIRYEMLF